MHLCGRCNLRRDHPKGGLP
uniref:Uncharacterized protein n=1 Tax=Anguilla anguilla TaxID=7936 RepID=A0A0E9TPP9_ANGAN